MAPSNIGYSLRECGHHFRRNWTTVLGAVVTIFLSLFIIGLFVLGSVMINNMVGSVEDTVTIQTEDGQELTFSLSDDTDRSQTDSLLAGNTLEVIYTGAIDGSDTSNVTVVQLVETGAEAE